MEVPAVLLGIPTTFLECIPGAICFGYPAVYVAFILVEPCLWSMLVPCYTMQAWRAAFILEICSAVFYYLLPVIYPAVGGCTPDRLLQSPYCYITVLENCWRYCCILHSTAFCWNSVLEVLEVEVHSVVVVVL